MGLTPEDERDYQDSLNDYLEAENGEQMGETEQDELLFSQLAVDQDLILEYLKDAKTKDKLERKQLENSQDHEALIQEGSEKDLDDQGSTGRDPSIVDSLITDDNTVSRRASIASETLSIASSSYSEVTSLTPSRSLLSPFRNLDSARQNRRLTSLTAPLSQSPSLSVFHSRASSVSNFNDASSSEGLSNPRDVIRWKRLKRISARLYSDAGKRNWGNPTAFCVSGVIAVGTSKGLVLLFDYHQTLRSIMGPGSKGAVESGAVTSITVSADHAYIATGHARGSIFLWDLSKSAQPARSIPALSSEEIRQAKASGHRDGNVIIDTGFIGASHSHLVSFDDHGMGFDHLFSRKMIVTSVHSTRIIGRQLGLNGETFYGRSSPLMAFSPLPLGSASHFSDMLGIVAMVTLSRLIIISTVPVPRTQFKFSRPRHSPDPSDIAEGACLAWYPSVKYRVPGNSSLSELSSKPALAFAWDKYLAILHIMDTEQPPSEDKSDIPAVAFAVRVERHVDEPIVAIKWFTHEILLLLTKTHRVLILEAASLDITDSGDIVSKSLLHFNYLTSSLKIDQNLDVTPATSDMFHQTLHTYKNKIFMLCSTGIILGMLSTWADRVLGFVDRSDFIEAIRLCTSYYAGGRSLVTLGLPIDEQQRKHAIEDKILDFMLASLRYTFKKETNARSDPLNLHRNVASLKGELTSVCFEACICMDNMAFLFDQIYEFYEEEADKVIFLEALENYITSFKIRKMPPTVVKDFIELYCSRKQFGLLERVICHIDALSLDINQVITLCKNNNLFDPQIYIWNEALEDYIAPMIEFVQLARDLLISAADSEQLPEDIRLSQVTRLFPYLSYILTGRIYPTGEVKDELKANGGKNALYHFLFSGRTLIWPPKGGVLITTTINDEPELTFPYLRLFLRLDTPTFLQAMDEALEDPYLNGQEELSSSDYPETAHPFNINVNRQFIVNILMEVMSIGFSQEDLLFLYIFIARNVPKYPQFIMLSGSTLEHILAELCSFKDPELAEECQLSVEYLLSTFKPFDTEHIIELYQEAKFWRVLRSAYRTDKKYDKMLLAYFDDPDARSNTLVALEDLLRPSNELNTKQLSKVRDVVLQKCLDFVQLDPRRFSRIVEENLCDIHPVIIEKLKDYPEMQFQYLDYLLGLEQSPEDGKGSATTWITKDFRHLYIKLSARFRPLQVKAYLESQSSQNYQEEIVISILGEYDILDAMVSILCRKGLHGEAMDLILDRLQSCTELIWFLLNDMKAANRFPPEFDQLKSQIHTFQQDVLIGRSMCEDLSKLPSVRPSKIRGGKELNPIEMNWLKLISNVSSSIRKIATVSESVIAPLDITLHQSLSKSGNLLVQDLFTSLLSVTSSSSLSVNFIKVLGAFLKQISEESPRLEDVRETLSNIFDAYIYEPQILSLALQIIDRDIFLEVDDSIQKRRRGWRPSGFECDRCGAKIWGTGVIRNIYEAWDTKMLADIIQRTKSREAENKSLSAGKSKQNLEDLPLNVVAGEANAADLIVFACGHCYHRAHFSDQELNGMLICDICREKESK
ncbi:Vacuolar protein sorting-associated protein 8 [Neolecta irregularis DAH-3]|uniref:Vacuolar protein sorting-associated protein 8 n=1 Tax=Neolecta irregularis (strain DAH-3) TaxID=1198029 RepID=A0A1U7LJB1_NEOID|nr:Vacuolar protein sorting-associated protein 8 [Neolecta irregularis DAH-3]|eukprot:OLL22734.1 Vacuolar protein sorting-associated protein 8 [Neolecta irregularis DAH-3]